MRSRSADEGSPWYDVQTRRGCVMVHGPVGSGEDEDCVVDHGPVGSGGDEEVVWRPC